MDEQASGLRTGTDASLEDLLVERFRARTARVTVVGLGYVGLTVAASLAEVGFAVTGIEVNPLRLDSLARGESYVPDVASPTLERLLAGGTLRAGDDYRAVLDADAVIICVPTPLSKTKDPDFSYLLAAGDEIAQYSHRGLLVVLESTTYPGTVEEVILPRLASNGAEVGRDLFVAFSPERIDPGRQDFTFRNTPKVIGGVTPACTRVAAALYEAVVDRVVPVSSPRAAEMVKLLENTFRAVNIALANEVAMICDRLDVDVWEVIGAAATKPFGYMRFDPGPGLGGHCIPIDPLYLSWKLKTINSRSRFIDLATEINGSMPEFWIGKLVDLLNGAGRPVKGSRILVLGVSYKPDVADTRESPALDIIKILLEKGADVSYHDPFVPDLQMLGFPLASVRLTPGILASADAAIIVTHHGSIDWQMVGNHAPRVVDTRGILRQRMRV